MFRPMRRKKKEISTEAAKQLLLRERRGVFAVNGDIFERNVVEIGTVERANVHSAALTEFVVIPTVVVIKEHIAVVETDIGVVAVGFGT